VSLVNDMLKDLDQHEMNNKQRLVTELKIADHASNYYGSSFDDKLGEAKGRKGKKISVFLGLMVFIMVLFGYYYKQSQSVPYALPAKPNVDDVLLTSSTAKKPAQVLMDRQQGTIERTIEIESSGASSSFTQTEFVKEVVSTRTKNNNKVVQLVDIPEQPVVEKNIDIHVDQLLEIANAALKDDRSTTPKADNAHDRYRAILELKPDHSEANKGLVIIQDRYLSLIKSAILNKQYYKVPTLVRWARQSGASQNEIDQLFASLPESVSRPAKEVINQFEQVNREQKNPLLAGNTKVNNMTRSFASLDSQVANTAAEDIHNKRYQQAENRLTVFINENDKSVYALQKLFDLYVSQQRLNDAEKIIDKAAHLPGEWFSYMVAQVLTRRSDYEGAMRALNSHSPEIYDMPNFYALKAGLMNKLDSDEKAIPLYRQLLLLDSRNTSYWLGLSVALDTINSDEALSAYENTLKVAPRNAAYSDYIRRRISELTRQYRVL
jgi:hypothetical protein